METGDKRRLDGSLSWNADFTFKDISERIAYFDH